MLPPLEAAMRAVSPACGQTNLKDCNLRSKSTTTVDSEYQQNSQTDLEAEDPSQPPNPSIMIFAHAECGVDVGPALEEGACRPHAATDGRFVEGSELAFVLPRSGRAHAGDDGSVTSPSLTCPAPRAMTIVRPALRAVIMMKKGVFSRKRAKK